MTIKPRTVHSSLQPYCVPCETFRVAGATSYLFCSLIRVNCANQNAVYGGLEVEHFCTVITFSIHIAPDFSGKTQQATLNTPRTLNSNDLQQNLYLEYNWLCVNTGTETRKTSSNHRLRWIPTASCIRQSLEILKKIKQFNGLHWEIVDELHEVLQFHSMILSYLYHSIRAIPTLRFHNRSNWIRKMEHKRNMRKLNGASKQIDRAVDVSCR